MAKFDWAFSNDGDLVLGDPQLDENGRILYLHPDGTTSIEMGEEGRPIRDIGVVFNLETEKQIIMNRLNTDSPDWYHHPRMGGNLSDLIGEPNTRATGERGAALIREALTYKSLYSVNQLLVRAIPINQHEILFKIDITKYSKNVISLPLVFNLQHGLLSFYEKK